MRGALNQIAGQLDGIAGQLGQVDVSGVAALEEGAAKAAGAVQGLRDGGKIRLRQSGEALKKFSAAGKRHSGCGRSTGFRCRTALSE